MDLWWMSYGKKKEHVWQCCNLNWGTICVKSDTRRSQQESQRLTFSPQFILHIPWCNTVMPFERSFPPCICHTTHYTTVNQHWFEIVCTADLHRTDSWDHGGPFQRWTYQFNYMFLPPHSMWLIRTEKQQHFLFNWKPDLCQLSRFSFVASFKDLFTGYDTCQWMHAWVFLWIH